MGTPLLGMFISPSCLSLRSWNPAWKVSARDPRMYKLCLERLGRQPSESIFLDDLGPNLKAAAGLGIHTIKVMVTVF